MLLLGFFQSLFFFLKWRPNVIFSKGGFAAVPALFAAGILRIPILAHETDVVSGWTSRLSRFFAREVLCAWDGIGNPVREEIFQGNPQNIPAFPNPHLPLVFGFFGSQGARSVNTLFFEIAEKIPANVLWIVGTGNLPSREFSPHIRLMEFVGMEFADYLIAADLVISRAGGSIFEIAAAQKPALLLPLSGSANDHQHHNAQKLQTKNAAEILEEKTTTPRIFLEKIKTLLENYEKRKELAHNIAFFSSRDSADIIAKYILTLAK